MPVERSKTRRGKSGGCRTTIPQELQKLAKNRKYASLDKRLIFALRQNKLKELRTIILNKLHNHWIWKRRQHQRRKRRGCLARRLYKKLVRQLKRALRKEYDILDDHKARQRQLKSELQKLKEVARSSPHMWKYFRKHILRMELAFDGLLPLEDADKELQITQQALRGKIKKKIRFSEETASYLNVALSKKVIQKQQFGLRQVPYSVPNRREDQADQLKLPKGSRRAFKKKKLQLPEILLNKLAARGKERALIKAFLKTLRTEGTTEGDAQQMNKTYKRRKDGTVDDIMANIEGITSLEAAGPLENVPLKKILHGMKKRKGKTMRQEMEYLAKQESETKERSPFLARKQSKKVHKRRSLLGSLNSLLRVTNTVKRRKAHNYKPLTPGDHTKSFTSDAMINALRHMKRKLEPESNLKNPQMQSSITSFDSVTMMAILHEETEEKPKDEVKETGKRTIRLHGPNKESTTQKRIIFKELDKVESLNINGSKITQKYSKLLLETNKSADKLHTSTGGQQMGDSLDFKKSSSSLNRLYKIKKALGLISKPKRRATKSLSKMKTAKRSSERQQDGFRELTDLRSDTKLERLYETKGDTNIDQKHKNASGDHGYLDSDTKPEMTKDQRTKNDGTSRHSGDLKLEGRNYTKKLKGKKRGKQKTKRLSKELKGSDQFYIPDTIKQAKDTGKKGKKRKASLIANDGDMLYVNRSSSISTDLLIGRKKVVTAHAKFVPMPMKKASHTKQRPRFGEQFPDKDASKKVKYPKTPRAEVSVSSFWDSTPLQTPQKQNPTHSMVSLYTEDSFEVTKEQQKSVTSLPLTPIPPIQPTPKPSKQNLVSGEQLKVVEKGTSTEIKDVSLGDPPLATSLSQTRTSLDNKLSRRSLAWLKSQEEEGSIDSPNWKAVFKPAPDITQSQTEIFKRNAENHMFNEELEKKLLSLQEISRAELKHGKQQKLSEETASPHTDKVDHIDATNLPIELQKNISATQEPIVDENQEMLGKLTNDLESGALDEDLHEIVGAKMDEYKRVYQLLLMRKVPKNAEDIRLLKNYTRTPEMYNDTLTKLYEMRILKSQTSFGVSLVEMDYDRTMEALNKRHRQIRLGRTTSGISLNSLQSPDDSFEDSPPVLEVPSYDPKTVQLRWARYFAEQQKTPLELLLEKQNHEKALRKAQEQRLRLIRDERERQRRHQRHGHKGRIDLHRQFSHPRMTTRERVAHELASGSTLNALVSPPVVPKIKVTKVHDVCSECGRINCYRTESKASLIDDVHITEQMISQFKYLRLAH
ncbi:uncharacterized protein LOC115620914 [Scaptodrosophila lebanonensis]|uniref:Uncharacterized protein LOC115620914 n=1 Tax=Drosophila lebanonensis TaxID=7225 RepID=A0A6J2T4R1_DROLE|nr:uncharacterized protein LOC115620914 [Scaptodrosophila lebanonensis]